MKIKFISTMDADISVKENKKNIGSLFDRIAPGYDKLNHLLSLNIDKYWRKKAAKELNKNTYNILDVATGTCDFAIELIKRKKTSHLVGIDLSKEMIKIGKDKFFDFIDKHQHDYNDVKVTIMQADCTSLPFKDNSFAALTCAYGVRNFSDLNKGLGEMYRVLTPNGKLVILEFTYPKNKLIKFFYNIYFTNVLPWVGKIISKDNSAYKYLPASVKAFATEEQFIQNLETIGFKNTKYKNLTFGISTIYTATK